MYPSHLLIRYRVFCRSAVETVLLNFKSPQLLVGEGAANRLLPVIQIPHSTSSRSSRAYDILLNCGQTTTEVLQLGKPLRENTDDNVGKGRQCQPESKYCCL